MSEINILQFPNQILEKILGFVEDHWLVASVCKKFYKVDCKRTQKKLVMDIDDEKVQDEKIRQSILKTDRICSNMDVGSFGTQQFLAFLKEAFVRHGKSVVQIRLNLLRSEMTEMDLIELLNLLPNIETLLLTFELADARRSQEGATLALSLPKLRKVNYFSCSDAKFLTKYLAKDSLDTLDASVNPAEEKDEEAYRDLIKSQQSIKHIEGSFALQCVKHFDGLQLESLDINVSFFDFREHDVIDMFCKFLKSQTDLKSLYLGSSIKIEDNMFEEICKVKTLEQLEIDISRIPHVLIRNLCNLTNLKVLKVFSDEKMPIIAMSHLRLNFLEKLLVAHGFRLRHKIRNRFEENFAGVEQGFYRYSRSRSDEF